MVGVGQNQWYHFGVGAPPILGFILVVGLGCSLGVRAFDPMAIWGHGCCLFRVSQTLVVFRSSKVNYPFRG